MTDPEAFTIQATLTARAEIVRNGVTLTEEDE